MRYYLFTIYLAVLLSVPASHGDSFDRSRTTCPETSRMSKELVEGFIESSTKKYARDQLGLSGADPEDVEVVTDRSVCDALLQKYQDPVYVDYNVRFYRVGDVYFATVILKPVDDPDIIQTGASLLHVYDKNFQKVSGYSYG